jgi:Fe2+ transport system protein FeoA
MPLSELPDGATARVLALDPRFRGFARRRLLDLGFTPGAEVTVALANAFGDPRGYRVRGTLVALRGEQARFVWVRIPQAEGEE